MSRLNPWLSAPLLAVAASAALWVQRSAVPARGDWEAATERVRAGLAPGDGVAWAPYYAGEGRLFLHGLPGFHLPDVAAADLARYDRVWLMGAFGRSADDLPGGHTRVSRDVFGGVTLDLVQVGGEKVVGDLYADLEQVEVVRVGGGEQRCGFWDGRGWHCDLAKSEAATRQCLGQPVARRLAQQRKDPHCGLNPWLNVSRDVRVIARYPRRCVWFHPVAGKAVEIRWPTAPAGQSLVVDYGFTDQAITDNTLPQTRTRPAQLTVKRGGEALGERTAEPVAGWHRWRVDLPAGAAPLTLAVTSASTTDAHLCVDVTVRGPR